MLIKDVEGVTYNELGEIELKKFDKDLKVERPIEKSHYIYTYTFTVRNEKYAVVMDSSSGNILSVEIEDQLQLNRLEYRFYTKAKQKAGQNGLLFCYLKGLWCVFLSQFGCKKMMNLEV